MLADDHRLLPRQVRLHRMQVHCLVRLEDAPALAGFVAQQQVHRPEAADGRTPHRGDTVHQRGQDL